MEENSVSRGIKKWAQLDFEGRTFAIFAVCMDSLGIAISAVLLLVYYFFDALGLPKEDENGVKTSNGKRRREK